MALNLKARQLSWLDHVRLSTLVRTPRAGLRLPPHTADLAEEVLDLAEQLDPRHMPPHVVTMGSRVRLVASDGPMEVTLSYPRDARLDEGRISVFSPLGLSLLGAELGERVEWTGPDGDTHAAEVAALLFQPEAAGDFTT
jgi:regulator of nucleoside diphosphate kinase